MRLSAYVCELAGRGGGLEAGALAAELERLAGALALQAPQAEWAKQHALRTCTVRALAFLDPLAPSPRAGCAQVTHAPRCPAAPPRWPASALRQLCA